MKNLFVFIMLLLFGASTVQGQACFPNGISFNSQSEIDDFAMNNPNCHSIIGDLTISGLCSQLNGLSSIDTIYGRLSIHYDSVLTTLTGLEQLKYVRRGITIIKNSQLVDISALSGIDPEGFTPSNFANVIRIYDNQSLTSCNIATICQVINENPNWVKIYNNGGPGCNSLSGTGCVNYAPGECLIEGIVFKEQSEIDSFVLNTGCKNILGSVRIELNITNLEGLLGLKSIGGDLLVRNAPLNSLVGLDSLHHIGGSLELTRLPTLDLQGLSHLEEVETLEIGGCDSLVNLEGLGSLRKVGSLKIGSRAPYLYLNNKNLLTLDGLTSIDSIGKLALVKSDTLQSLKGLSHLTKLNDLEIGSNYSLKNFEGLENITSLSGNLYLGVGVGFGIGQGYHLSFTGNGITSFKGLEQLTHVGGNFHILNSNNLLNFNYLDNLEEISGDFIVGDFYEYLPNFQSLVNADNLELSSFSGLGKLKKIGGNFKCYGTNKVVDFSGFSLLDSIGGDLNLASSNLLSLNGLSSTLHIGGSINLGIPHWTIPLTDLSALNISDTIHGHLTLIGLDSIKNLDKFMNLKVVEGDLKILNMNELTTLNGLNNLTMVNGSLEVGKVYQYGIDHYWAIFLGNSKLTSLDGLDNLIDVKESLTITGNPMLTSLSFLNPNLQIGKSISIGSMKYGSYGWSEIKFATVGNDLLVDLTGFPKQSELNGSLTIAGNQSLGTLAELSSLTKIKDDLYLIGNNSLPSLSGLDNLTEVSGLSIGKVEGDTIIGNSSLTSLHGLEDLTIKEELSIVGNEQLSICNILSVCKVLDTLPNIIIQDNADGCNAADELECDNFFFSGKVFYDENQNGVYDNQDFGLENQHVGLSPQGINILTDNEGNFKWFGNEGEYYTFSWINDGSWTLTTDSADYHLLFEYGNPQNNLLNFGIYPSVTVHSGVVNLSSNPTRCNEQVGFQLRASNLGTFGEQVKVRLNYDPTSSFISASPPPSTVDEANHQLVWIFDTIQPFHHEDIDLILEMPNQNATNTKLSFLSEMYRDSSGIDVLMDSFAYKPLVLCSFDPNDKQVMPAGEQDAHYTLHNQKLTYTVRFQNTGNAEAINITILDTIDMDLDINTLRIVNSSFPVQTDIQGQVVHFSFENIWLPDSTSNEAGSHGFVTYEIQPVSGLDDYTSIENTAYIIFDSNDAIITNTTQNTMVTMIPVGISELESSSIHISPNPANNYIYLTSTIKPAPDNVLIYNQLGQVILAEKYESKLDISALIPGIYFVEVHHKKGIMRGKLVVE